MAQNYRVPGEYNIDYSAPEPHQQRPYESHPQQLQHTGGPGLEPLQSAPHPQHHHSQLGYGSTSMQPHLAYGTTPIQPPIGSKRSRPHDEHELEFGGLPTGLHDEGMDSMSHQGLGGYGQHSQEQRYHVHQLPESARPPKIARYGEAGESSSMSQNAPSVVGQPGMPLPAPKPRGPKLKFTPEDDQLLVDLKENKSLTWKQIAEFFPGRSSGTLQVRYCTNLKAKTTQWTEETVSSLLQRTLMWTG
jgi:hypothetical protein